MISAPAQLVLVRWPLVLVLLAACGAGSLEGDDRVDASSDSEADAATAGGDASIADGGGEADSAPPQPDAEPEPEPVDCTPIAADPDFELCESGADYCAGVFTDGSGCAAFCGAAGLVCVARFGGEPGCQEEPANPLDCYADNGHASDWCVCGPPAAPGECQIDPLDPPILAELDKDDASYTKRHNWVLECYPYAYTASGAEHQACDPDYAPDGSRTGTATFLFGGVPRGLYDVHIQSRHTENRNPAGALFYVDGHPKVIDQRDAADYVWDFHGTYCLDGDVEVILDSEVNTGSDSVMAVRLSPAP